MSSAETRFRRLDPGTSGWAASDLDDPQVARQWDAGHFEIINGVVAKMPPADFVHGEVVIDLLVLARGHLRSAGVTARISSEVDLVVDEDNVLRVDGMLVTDEEAAAQKRVLVGLRRDAATLGRIRVAPRLVIESVSPGHERHDRSTKRRIYAGFGIPNYWIVDAMRRSLECLVLRGEGYHVDAAGREEDVLRPAAFDGLEIRLVELWRA